jgi:hypothetical protein
MMRKVMFLTVVLVICAAGAAFGSVYIPAGYSSTVGYSATLSISGDVLTIVLKNESTVTSANPTEVLTSFYFDVYNGTSRPTLTLSSAVGDLYLTHDKTGTTPDELWSTDYSLLPQNLPAGSKAGNLDQWQFKSGLTLSGMYFGIGTVGNSTLASPNNFDGNLVDALNLGIYHGDVATQNLDDYVLVKDQATFTFTGATGFTDADINTAAVFGTGTAPDLLVPGPRPLGIPEPASLLVWTGIAGLGAAGTLLRRKRRPRWSDENRQAIVGLIASGRKR